MSAQIPVPSDPPHGAHPLDVCIVTGLSGAGKSTALKVFEDVRYFTVDGLPGALAPDMASLLERPSMAHFRGIALGMDVRQGSFLKDIGQAIEQLRQRGIAPQVLFLEAALPVLMLRYAATRRPHPLEREGMGLEAALKEEKERLEPLRRRADLVLDTSVFSIHDLRRAIQRRWNGSNRPCVLQINVISFGFKYGVPKEADFVFDVRFLPNPYFVEALRPLTGREKSVADFVLAEDSSREFLDKLVDFLLFSLPLVEAEGRYRLTIAIGCTGGRHRSVALAEAVHRVLRQSDYQVALEHRHLELG